MRICHRPSKSRLKVFAPCGNSHPPLISNSIILCHCLRIVYLTQKIAIALGYLQDAHLAPVDLMIHVLDPQLPEFDRCHISLYKEDGKLAGLMDMITSDQWGQERLGQWMQPHVVNTTCSIVDQEMELVKSRLTLPMNHITPNYQQLES
jgi:hypothetical protein